VTQSTLPGLDLDPSLSLTPRQSFALNLIRERGPLSSEELGAHLCSRNLRHSSEQRCEWDVSNGRGVAEALARKGLVRRVRGEGWVVADWRAPVEGYDPATAEIPF